MSNTKIIIRAMTAWRFSTKRRPMEVKDGLDLTNKLIEENISLRFQLDVMQEMQESFANQLSKTQTNHSELLYALEVILPYANTTNMSGYDSAITMAKEQLEKNK